MTNGPRFNVIADAVAGNIEVVRPPTAKAAPKTAALKVNVIESVLVIIALGCRWSGSHTIDMNVR